MARHLEIWAFKKNRKLHQTHQTMKDIPYDEIGFLRQWIAGSVMGLVAGMWLSWHTPRISLDIAQILETALSNLFPGQGIGEVIRTLPTYLVTTTSVGSVIVLLLGFAQWVVLWRWVPWAKEWLMACVAGAGGSYLLMAVMNILAILLDPITGLLKILADSGLWVGGITGVLQWFILRKYTKDARWWIVASIVVLGTGLAFMHYFGQPAANFLSSGMRFIIRRGMGLRNLAGIRFFVLGQILLWVTGGAIGGFITGKVWIWLAENSNDV
jgi:hypothetical protein